MKTQYKLFLGLLPYVAAGLVLSSLTFPKIGDDQEKSSELTSKRQEYTVLQNKLQERKRAELQKQSLESDITALRGAVPKSPELDLMMIDLEKMCSDSNVDLVAVESPTQETMHDMASSEDEIKALMGDSQGKIGLGAKPMLNALPSKTGATAANADDTGLKRLVKQVFVTGDYNGIVTLMKKLEAYQRVVGVNQLALAVKGEATGGDAGHSPAHERAQKMALKQPMLSFLLTLYYLP